MHKLIDHKSEISLIASNLSKNLIATAGDKNVKVWKYDSAIKPVILNHKEIVNYVEFNKQGTLALTLTDDNTIHVWNPSTGQRISKWQHKDKRKINSASFDKTGSSIVTSGSGKAYVWDTQGKTIRLLDHSIQHEILLAKYNLHGDKIATISLYDAYIWNVANGKMEYSFPFDSMVPSVTFSPAGDKLFSLKGKSGNLWDIKTGKKIQSFGMAGVSAFNPTGDLLAIGYGAGYIDIISMVPIAPSEEVKKEQPKKEEPSEIYVNKEISSYEILGVLPSDDDETIKQAFRKLALKWHPDKWGQGSAEEKKIATEKMKSINEAYQIIQKQRNSSK